MRFLTCGLVLAALAVGGCGGPTSKPAESDGKKDQKPPKDGAPQPDKDGQANKDKKDDGKTAHEGWWCDEHGVPEKECTRCSPKARKASIDKGDWCAKHERAQTQCFLCDPKLQEKFAARYKAMNDGKAPPPITDP